MIRPRLLDLFCGAGGAAAGYNMAGFEVVGVDIEPQPNYPYEFHRADALTFPLDGFDAVHASPPCQAYSAARFLTTRTFPDLLPAVRAKLVAAAVPWVIESVVGAPGPWDIRLCGTMFGLVGDSGRELRRHRLFQASFPVGWWQPPRCNHRLPVLDLYGGSIDRWNRQPWVKGTKAEYKRTAGIEWMTTDEAKAAIPPVYTRWVGERLFAEVMAVAA